MQILEVDLNQKSCHIRNPGSGGFRDCIGGRGYNVDYLYRHLPDNARPLGPENILIMSGGLLTGGPVPASARVHLNALSPLTGILGSSNIGGNIGRAMVKAGLKSICIRGQASSPLYLLIDGTTVSFCDADHLWGLDTWSTQEALEAEHGTDTEIMAIGPAGENKVRFAAIISDRDHAFGRTGMGAVMGSKRLKALVIRNRSQAAELANPIAVAAIRNYVREIRLSPEFRTFSEYGGAGYVSWANDLGILATRNFRRNRFEAIDQIDGRKLRRKMLRSRGCRGCPVRCKAALETGGGKDAKQTAVRPEFESMVNLGAKCGLEDMDALVALDNRCSRLGLDTISAGNVMAFAMDLYERGILASESTRELDLSWGNPECMMQLLELTAHRRGLGRLMSLGVRQMAEAVGNGAACFAPHVKGLELSAYHPGSIMGAALGYAVSSRGGDFSNIYASMEYNWSAEKGHREFGHAAAVQIDSIIGKAKLVRRAMLVNIALDCIGICKVPALSLLGKFDLKDEAQLVSAATGEEVSAVELFDISERISNLERLFNLKYGAGPGDDSLPAMFLDETTTTGAGNMAGKLQQMIDDFYLEMGWDDQGYPTPQKLSQLGIPIPPFFDEIPGKAG